MNAPFRAAEALPMQTRAIEIGPNSINREARTVDVVFSTGASVRRRRWTGWDSSVPFDEVLVISRDAIDMTRLNAGAPALDSHSMYSSTSQVGVVERAWIEGGEARATIRFPSAGVDEAADRMFALVSEGIIRNVSVGYTIDQARVVEAENKGDVEKRFVERWTPMEISFVTIPADSGAQVRSGAEMQTFPVTITRAAAPNAEESDMPDNQNRAAAEENADTNNTTQRHAAPENAAVNEAAVRAERARVSAIIADAERFNAPAELRQRAIDTEMTNEAFRAAILETQAGGQRPASHVRIEQDETETRMRAMQEAVVRQLMPDDNAADWSGPAAEFRGVSLVGLAAIRMGERRTPETFGDREDILRRAMHSTSDFPLLLENAMNKSLAARYELARPTYREISVREDFNDFRPHISLTEGDFPTLLPVGEGGEIKYGTVGEKKEQVAVLAYARALRLSRQLLVNDNLGALARALDRYGQTVALFEERTAYAVINANSGDGPTLLEGAAAMFTTGRTNKAGAAAAITVAAVGAGRAAMRGYKSIDGNELLYNAPSILLVGSAKETEAETFVAAVVPAQQANVNPFSGKLRPVVSPFIAGNRWSLYCDPSVRTNFRWGYLNGYTAPRVRMDEPFGQQGIGVSVEHDFGFGGVDWRAGYTNAGA